MMLKLPCLLPIFATLIRCRLLLRHYMRAADCLRRLFSHAITLLHFIFAIDIRR